MTIALTGATGFVGRAVLDEAQRRGVTLRALTRREQVAREGVQWVTGTLADNGALAHLVEGAEAVIHVAGLTNSPDPADFHEANVVGTQKLLKAELPFALPQIMAGLNQTIMLSLSMVVVAALVGADGLGVPVVRALNSVNTALGFESGFVIVVVAIILDRMLRIGSEQK